MPTYILERAGHIVSIVCLGSMLIAGCASAPNQHAAGTSAPLSQTVYSDDGVSELSTPGTWTVRPDFGPDASIRVAESRGTAFLIVNSYFPGEIETTPISEFSKSYAEGLTESLGNSKLSEGEMLSVNGAPAHRYVVTGSVGDVRLTYVSTVVNGASAMHHLIGWVAAPDYSGDGDILNRVIATFRESPNPRPARQRVSLNFAWPDSLRSAVNFQQKSIKRGKESELKATYLTTVRPGPSSPDELVVSTRVMRQHLSGPDNKQEQDYLSALLKQASSEVPDYIVSREGEFLRVDNLSAYQQRIESTVMSNLPPQLEDQKDKILAMVKPAMSERFLAATATDEWNKTVGGWISSSYVVGQTYRFSEEYYAPALGNTPFAMTVSRRIAGFAPCTGTETKCVKLVLIATVSGEDFRSAMTDFLEKTVGEPVNVKHISVVKKMEIIAEPSTLIPHRTRSSEETTVTIEDSKGNARTSRDTKDTRITYSYESYRAAR
ncbi:MAG: hypothetical protein JSU95_16730 [Betaproteobacteria bacterium]|nr:MAG: hypothetical protein JSU95_16730 [Betaproteobacteria bacterium]